MPPINLLLHSIKLAKGFCEMIRENNVMTFTKRLNYPVDEIPPEEFLSAINHYAQTKENKKHAKDIQTKFHQMG